MPVFIGQQSTLTPLSWNLTIDSNIVLATGSMTIGALVVQLVNHLDLSEDFSDHALWWPKANIWLINTKWTVDQYGVQADAQLTFTSMHKSIHLQLPDLRILSMRVDFSVSVFASVSKLCKELGIRHAEELSFLRLPNVSHSNERHTLLRRPRHPKLGTLNRYNSVGDSLASNTSMFFPLITPKLYSTLTKKKVTYPSFQTQRSKSTLSKSLNNLTVNDGNLARTPLTLTRNMLPELIRPINSIEKCRFNSLWLDSSKSLMEQNIQENDFILLRFKYYSFYDLNPKFDAIRLNQLYEQSKWSILSEDMDCTEEEMMTFAALQLQIQIQSSSTSTSTINNQYDDTDINQALDRLQNSFLDKIKIHPTHLNIHQSLKQELCDYLRLFKPRRFTLKSYKRYWFVLRNTQLTYYIDESQQYSTPIERLSLKGCEILPDVNVLTKKYSIRLLTPTIDGMNETLIKCSTEKQYATWMAAFRLASKGRTTDESSYETERESILALLNMQLPSSHSQHINSDIQPENYVSTKFSKRYRPKQLTERILEAHVAVSNLDGTEAKLRYLKAWQSLPEFGITTFIVKFKDSNKKEELFGIAPNRLLRMTMIGTTIKTWWISRMRSWYVNWEKKVLTIEFDGETIQISPLYGIDSKCIHEFIGAYIFLAMRSNITTMSDNSDPLRQEQLFQQLTAAYL